MRYAILRNPRARYNKNFQVSHGSRAYCATTELRTPHDRQCLLVCNSTTAKASLVYRRIEESCVGSGKQIGGEGGGRKREGGGTEGRRSAGFAVVNRKVTERNEHIPRIIELFLSSVCYLWEDLSSATETMRWTIKEMAFVKILLTFSLMNHWDWNRLKLMEWFLMIFNMGKLFYIKFLFFNIHV